MFMLALMFDLEIESLMFFFLSPYSSLSIVSFLSFFSPLLPSIVL